MDERVYLASGTLPLPCAHELIAMWHRTLGRLVAEAQRLDALRDELAARAVPECHWLRPGSTLRTLFEVHDGKLLYGTSNVVPDTLPHAVLLEANQDLGPLLYRSINRQMKLNAAKRDLQTTINQAIFEALRMLKYDSPFTPGHAMRRPPPNRVTLCDTTWELAGDSWHPVADYVVDLAPGDIDKATTRMHRRLHHTR